MIAGKAGADTIDFGAADMGTDNHRIALATDGGAASTAASPPNDIATLRSLVDQGNALFAQHHLAKAERCYRRAIELAPNLPEAHNNLGTVLKEQGLIEEAAACFERALALRSNYASAHSNLLFTRHYVAGQTLAGLRRAHERWARDQLGDLPAFADTLVQQRGPGEAMTVGLLSPDLYYHPVGIFILPWLVNHDRSRFRLICYADGPREDRMTQQIRSQAALWRNVAGHTDDALIEQIVADGVAILIDLAGHTAGNRLRLFARRAAPVQVTWLGYPSTTGVPAMDYILMDEYSAPPGYEGFFTEKLLRLDGLRFCYTSPPYAPPVAPAPVISKGYVTFGSFSNLAKLTPGVLRTWAEILRRVPDSRLVLKWKSLADTETQARIRAVFSKHGIAPERIDCRSWSPHPTLLAEYGDVDIALDPFPFSGGLTTCDALYMGVPVVTLAGELPIGRQSASFLNAMGLDELIAHSDEEYLGTAVALAGSRERMAALRQCLRGRMLSSRLCDGEAYARAVEKALYQMVQPRENGQEITDNHP